MALFADEETGHGHVGIIDPECNVISVIHGWTTSSWLSNLLLIIGWVSPPDAALNAQRLCETYYSTAPEINCKAVGSPGE